MVANHRSCRGPRRGNLPAAKNGPAGWPARAAVAAGAQRPGGGGAQRPAAGAGRGRARDPLWQASGGPVRPGPGRVNRLAAPGEEATLVNLDFLRPLYDEIGDYVSVYLDTDRAHENALTAIELRW